MICGEIWKNIENSLDIDHLGIINTGIIIYDRTLYCLVQQEGDSEALPEVVYCTVDYFYYKIMNYLHAKPQERKWEQCISQFYIVDTFFVDLYRNFATQIILFALYGFASRGSACIFWYKPMQFWLVFYNAFSTWNVRGTFVSPNSRLWY